MSDTEPRQHRTTMGFIPHVRGPRLALLVPLLTVAACRSAPAVVAEKPPSTPPPPGLTTSALTPEQKASHALSRLSYGPRPGDVQRLTVGGDAAVWAFVEEQLAARAL